jgi:hypothetical protein
MSVGVMKDYELKQRNLRASYTLGWSKIHATFFPRFPPHKTATRSFCVNVYFCTSKASKLSTCRAPPGIHQKVPDFYFNKNAKKRLNGSKL